MSRHKLKKNSPEEALEKLLLLYSNSNSRALLCDFDGTLAPIIDNPELARPPEQLCSALAGLSKHLEVVGIISGRELEFLDQIFSPYSDERNPIKLFGLYGAQSNDKKFSDLLNPKWMDDELEKELLKFISPILDEIEVEIKKTGIVLHYRLNPSVARDVLLLAEQAAHEFRLKLAPGKKVIELTIDNQINKATVVDYMQNYLDTICYIGDDYGDISAIDTVNRKVKNGLSIVVFSEEMPDELLYMSQLILPDTSAVHELIYLLLDGLEKQ